MTASKEAILEKIEKLKNLISDIEERGEDPLSAQKELDRLVSELSGKNRTLLENRSLLKG